MRLHRYFVVFGAVVSLLLATVTARSAPPASGRSAIGYANLLLGHSPTTRSEALVTAAPDQRLRKTPLNISSDQVERREFWISNESVNATFAALKAELTGRPVSSDGPSRRIREVDLEEHNLPATIADAYLVIRVVDTGDGHSAVGGYALVLAQPVRPAAEHVPLSVDTVQLVDEKETLTSDGGVIRRFRTVHGLLARQLVLEFDGLRAEPPGLNYAAVGCLESITATFRAGSQRWRASYSACGPVSVTRDGHRLPDLTDDKAFAKALIADSR